MNTEAILKGYEAKEENLLYILHDIQDAAEEHNLTDSELKKVADFLKIPVSRVNGVTGFYSMFSKRSRGKYIIRLCQSPPCYIKGSVNIYKTIKEYLNISENETTEDRLFTLEFSSCLGVCGLAPAVMINDDVYGNLTEKSIIEILNKYQNLEE